MSRIQNDDIYNLQRFLDAQRDIYEQVLAELKFGRKRGHWIWYIFPQVNGLGDSAMSKRYALASKEEAQAYIQHDVLGQRLLECTRMVIDIDTDRIESIFDYPDDLKFRSCMTLFKASAIDNQVFVDALHKYFDGIDDQRTLKIMGLS